MSDIPLDYDLLKGTDYFLLISPEYSRVPVCFELLRKY